MKCIAYISKVASRKNGASVPMGLSNIFSVARKNNANLNITGVLSYRKGHYIQILEGDDGVVDSLLLKIKSDGRHEQVNVILDFPISERSFPDWSMKLLQSVNKNRLFLEFVRRQSGAFEALSPVQNKLLRHFYDDRKYNGGAFSFDGKELMLSAWPDFMVLKQTPVIIELCARLTKQPQAYSYLVASNYFGTQEQLDLILNKFKSMEILNITESSDYKTDVGNTKNSREFYSRMKDFLRIG